jgi:hypothetical protein
MVFLLIATFLALGMLFIKWYKEGMRYIKTKLYIPIVIYSIAIFLASFRAEYKGLVLYGFPDRYEGAYILIAYVLIMIIVINLIENENHLKLIIGGLFISAILICIIGITQYVGHDIFSYQMVKNIIIPKRYNMIKDTISFSYEPHTMYGTLYHKDYMGSYMAMLFPLAFSIFLLVQKRSIKIIMAIVSLIMFIGWFGCNSRAALISGIAALILLLFMMNKRLIENWKILLLGLILIICTIVTFNTISKGRLLNRVGSIFSEVVKLVKNTNIDEEKRNNLQLTLKDVRLNENKLKITTDKDILNVELRKGNVLVFSDENDKKIKATIGNNKIVLEDENYKKYNITIGNYQEKLALKIQKDNFDLNFAMLDNELKMIDGKGKLLEIKSVEKIGFNGIETIGSSRGYIWSRTIPLILKKPILGYGPDTFAVYFPQYDYMGKYNNYEGRMWELVDKPHNLYLQIAFSTGIPSLIAFLVFIGMYFISSIKVYFNNNYDDISSIIGVGIFVAIVSYLVAGILNDSVVSVAPVFWVLLGLGININLKLNK